MAENKKPAIRFKGFTEEWEHHKLGELCDVYDGTHQTPEYKESGIMFLSVENIKTLKSQKYISKEDFEKDFSVFPEIGDVLMTRIGDIGTTNVVQSNEPKAYYVSLALLKKKILDPYFLKESIYSKTVKKEIWQRTLHIAFPKKINKNEITQVTVPYPLNKDEQKAIGRLFYNLDQLIIFYQCKYEKLQNVKKIMLEKMFPKNGSSVPEIRFKGFTEEWEQRKFGEIVDSYIEPVSTPHNGYIRLGIRSHAKGTFHNYVEKGKELETAQMYKVASGNFIVNITFAWEHAVAITDENDVGKLVSHRFPQFQFHKQLIPEFFKYVILDDKFRHHLWVASPGGAGRNRVLKINELLEYKMIFPCEKEQRKIATYFKHLDYLITLYQRKIEKLQNIKKSCLEKMFV